MNIRLSATFVGGLSAIFAIAYIQWGAIILSAFLVLLAFFVGLFFGALMVVSPLVRKTQIHAYWNGRKLVYESMLKPLTGLRDANNSLIKPGDVVMMNIDGALDPINRAHFSNMKMAKP
jgi:hypothetical protein